MVIHHDHQISITTITISDHDDDIEKRSHNNYYSCPDLPAPPASKPMSGDHDDDNDGDNDIVDDDNVDDNDDDDKDELMSYVCKSGRIVHRASNQRKASIKRASLDTGKVELVSSVDIFVCLSFGLRPGRAHTACPKSKGPNGLQLVQYYFK